MNQDRIRVVLSDIIRVLMIHYSSDVYFRNVPDSKWQILSNVLACVGKIGEMVPNWNN